MKYIRRIIDKDLDLRVKAFGAIQIVGAKGCGKTRTAAERSKTVISFEDTQKRDSYKLLVDTNPSSFFKRPFPILFDEWQDAPKIWDALRYECDKHSHFGDFFLTGSTSKNVNTYHTGTMRISTIEMLPMSLFESKESNGLISLSSLFNKKMDINLIKSKLSLENLINACCRGGWPKTFEIKDKKAKLLVAKDAYNQIYKKDISSIDGVKRSPEITRAILKSYARNIATLSKRKTIYEDVSSNVSCSLSSFDEYVEKLKELFVIKDYDAWCPNIRSAKALRAPRKHMFVDPSIAIAALGLNKDYFLNDFDMFGHVFESLVFRDLTIYSQALGGTLSHYHDAYDLEIDAVLHLEDGRYALIEIKLGEKRINQAIINLNKVKKLIKESNNKKSALKLREPDLMIVITAGDIAYEKDGVKVIPIGCLKD